MQDLKPWHIGLFVAAAAVMVGSFWFTLSDDSGADLADAIIMVDVSTGDLYRFSLTDRGVVIPARNPDTDKRALLPIQKEEDGKWRLLERYRGSINSLEVQPTAVVDTESGEVKVSSEKPKAATFTAPKR